MRTLKLSFHALLLAVLVSCTKQANNSGKVPESNVGPVLPGGLFGFVYPTFYPESEGVDSGEEFVSLFAGGKANPSWMDGEGGNIRTLNPKGMYFKHINLRALDNQNRGPEGSKIEGRPDYDWIHANHPEWILKDASGNPVPLWLPTEEALDFANDEYLDWVVNTWMPEQLFDANDLVAPVIYLQQDNGEFLGFPIDCADDDEACKRYTTNEGMESAWVHMLNRVKKRWPQVRIIISTGPNIYTDRATQMAGFKRVLGAADGEYCESLTDRHSYWKDTSPVNKRLALGITMELGSWLAANGKVFMPMEGQDDGIPLTQDDTDYAFAFFNLFRIPGSPQFYSQLMKIDADGAWLPAKYPEMFLTLGEPTEEATQISPNVYRRNFKQAVAYVNLSDVPITINLSNSMKNSLGIVVTTLTLKSFSGITLYR